MRSSVLFLSAAAALLFPGLILAATLRVPSEYPTIQSALDVARQGDQVLVAPGTYTNRSTKTLTGPPITGLPSTVTALAFIPAGVTLQSEAGAEQTILDGVDGTIRGVIVHGGKARDASAAISFPDATGIPPTSTATLDGFKLVNTTKAIVVGNVRFAIRNNDIGSRMEIYESTTTGIVEGNTTRAFVWCQTTSDEGVIWRGNTFEFTPSTAPPGSSDRGSESLSVPINCRCERSLWTRNIFRSALSAWSYASTAVAEVIDNQFMGTASISADYGANGLLRIMDNTMVGIPYGTAISAYGGPAVIMNNHVARYVTGVDVGNDVEIAYNIIEGCGTGIIGFGMGVFVHHNRILNCTERGIWAYRNTAGPIDDNEIRGCGSEGIRCEYGAPYARRNTIANNGGSGIETQGGYIEDNIIAWNGGDGLRIGGGVVIQPAYPGTISGNTIVRNGGDGLFLGATSNNSTDHNLVAFNDGYGIRCVNDYFPVSISCNDSYGNGDAPFGGVCADALGEDGNVSVDPLFCGGMLPDEAPGDFLLRSDSPCAPGNSECGLIGALPVGCAIEPPGKAATTHSTWGRIKARFR